MKKIFFFVFAIAISLVAASHRWRDSAHSMGLISAQGGRVKHPPTLVSGYEKYALILTTTVIPPYRGDARVVLEGYPELDHQIYVSGPVIDLGLIRHPVFKNGILYGLHPRDRNALWLVIKSKEGEEMKGEYALKLSDLKTGKSILSVPVSFKEKEAMKNAHRH
jgi:hypothetical protein